MLATKFELQLSPLWLTANVAHTEPKILAKRKKKTPVPKDCSNLLDGERRAIQGIRYFCHKSVSYLKEQIYWRCMYLHLLLCFPQSIKTKAHPLALKEYARAMLPVDGDQNRSVLIHPSWEDLQQLGSFYFVLGFGS